jgi:hypothetical protein
MKKYASYIGVIHDALNCQNVGKRFKFDARYIVVPYTATASAPEIEIKMATFTGAERAHCVF